MKKNKEIISSYVTKSGDTLLLIEYFNGKTNMYGIEDKWGVFVKGIKKINFAVGYIKYLCDSKEDNLLYSDWKVKNISNLDLSM